MKTITSPGVYLVGKQVVEENEVSRFLLDHELTWETDSEVGAEVLCETAGRLCYMSFAKPRPGGNAKYLGHIKEVGHGSVLEHAMWNFIFTGISRSCTHELVRHRAGMGYSQLSQRYVDESVAEYVVPLDLQLEVECAQYCRAVSAKPDEENYLSEEEADKRFPAAIAVSVDDFHELADIGETWLCAVETAHDSYALLTDHLNKKLTKKAYDDYVHGQMWTNGPVDFRSETLDREAWQKQLAPDAKTAIRKGARQAARSVLPNATETKIFVSMNARAARHFIEMRCSRHAEPEIRVLAHRLWQLLKEESPALFGDYQEVSLPDGTFELTTPHRKV